jgi:hypothetical protein
VDYESMSVRELQQACRQRGLPTARDKDTMVARLGESDAADQYEDGDALQPDAATTTSTSGQPEPVVPAADVVPVVHRERFPAREGGPDDAEHLACRASTIAAAQAHGYTTMGDAYRVATVDGMYVYEVHLRRGAR